MKIVWSNIRNLFKNSRAFALLIIITQIIGTFMVCMAVGLLLDNQYSKYEDDDAKKYFEADFDSASGLPEFWGADAALWEAYDDMPELLTDVTVFYMWYTDDGMTAVVSEAGFSDGGYVLPDCMEQVGLQVYDGRNLTQDDFDKASQVALVSATIAQDTVTVNGKEFTVIGRRNKYDTTTLPSVWIPITAFKDMSISSVNVKFNRVPTLAEYNKMVDVFQKYCPEGLTVSEYYAGSADKDAVYRMMILASAGILVIVLMTLWVLYSYVYDRRRKKLTVMKLCGCSNLQAGFYYVVESLILSAGACALGVGIFLVAKELWLDNYYTYMRVLFKPLHICACGLAVLAVILAEAVALANIKARQSVGEQLRGSQI